MKKMLPDVFCVGIMYSCEYDACTEVNMMRISTVVSVLKGGNQKQLNEQVRSYYSGPGTV
jgi:hypothetical protein